MLTVIIIDLHKSRNNSLFSFWDRLAKTFRLNPNPETIQLGLEQFDSEEHQTIKGMMKTPVKKPGRGK